MPRRSGTPSASASCGCSCERTPAFVGEIVDVIDLAQSTVSQHLKTMKDAGLIRGDVDGPRTCYCVEPRALRRLKALIGML